MQWLIIYTHMYLYNLYCRRLQLAMGPQEDYIETVFTCEGDYDDPHLQDRLEDFKKSLKDLLLTGNMPSCFISFAEPAYGEQEIVVRRVLLCVFVYLSVRLAVLSASILWMNFNISWHNCSPL